jgi:general secretion pathway protein L
MSKRSALADLSAPLSQVAQLWGQLAERWRAGFGDCLPVALGRRLAARHALLAVTVEGETATMSFERGEHRTRVGRVALGEPPTLQEALAPFRKLKPTAILRLPADTVITRRVELPAQIKKNLHNALVFEIDRLTPFQAAQVYFDYRVPPAEQRGGKVLIDLAVCLRDQVTPWVERMRAERAAPEGVTWDGGWAGANLLPAGDRRVSQGGGRLLAQILAGGALILAAAAALSPLWQQREQIIALTRAIEDLRPKAERAATLRKQLEETRQRVEFAVNQKNREPRLVDLLKDLTERLPDDTYVQNLEYTRGAAQLRGESAKATALIGSLEEVPGIDGVTFQSPVVQVPNTGKERFHLSFQHKRPEGQ